MRFENLISIISSLWGRERERERSPAVTSSWEKKIRKTQSSRYIPIRVYGRARIAPGSSDEIASGISIQRILYFSLKTPAALCGYYFGTPVAAEADFCPADYRDSDCGKGGLYIYTRAQVKHRRCATVGCATILLPPPFFHSTARSFYREQPAGDIRRFSLGINDQKATLD